MTGYLSGDLTSGGGRLRLALRARLVLLLGQQIVGVRLDEQGP
jgi:hypothetical protein